MWPNFRDEERGVALVEFALVVPLLLVLLFGMLDFGHTFNYWIDATHLANEGARWAVVNKNPASSGTLQEYIQQQADTHELRNGGLDLRSRSLSRSASASRAAPRPSATRSR